MRQEQSINRKKLGIDYMKTLDKDIVNIYYNLKRFQNNNPDIQQKQNKPRKTSKKAGNDTELKFQIDKSYLKILEKIDELLE